MNGIMIGTAAIVVGVFMVGQSEKKTVSWWLIKNLDNHYNCNSGESYLTIGIYFYQT